MAQNSMDLFSLLPTSHNYYSGVIPSIPSIMASERLNLPPVPSTVASCTLSDAPLPTPAGWWRRPSSSRSSLARDDDDGSNAHHCSCRRVVVILIVMLVVVLSLSVFPSRRCCHRRRCHRRTTNAQRPSPSPRPPPSPLRHNLICCSYHRRPHLAAAFTAVVNVVIVIAPLPHQQRKFPQRSYRAHRRRRCHHRCIRCSHRCHHLPRLRCHHRRSLHRRLRQRSFGRRLTLGLAATTARQGATLRSSRHGGRGLEIYQLELRVGRSSDQNQSRASFEQVFWRAAKNSRVNSKTTNSSKLPISKKNSAK